MLADFRIIIYPFRPHFEEVALVDIPRAAPGCFPGHQVRNEGRAHPRRGHEHEEELLQPFCVSHGRKHRFFASCKVGDLPCKASPGNVGGLAREGRAAARHRLNPPRKKRKEGLVRGRRYSKLRTSVFGVFRGAWLEERGGWAGGRRYSMHVGVFRAVEAWLGSFWKKEARETKDP